MFYQYVKQQCICLALSSQQLQWKESSCSEPWPACQFLCWIPSPLTFPDGCSCISLSCIIIFSFTISLSLAYNHGVCVCVCTRALAHARTNFSFKPSLLASYHSTSILPQNMFFSKGSFNCHFCFLSLWRKVWSWPPCHCSESSLLSHQ